MTRRRRGASGLGPGHVGRGSAGAGIPTVHLALWSGLGLALLSPSAAAHNPLTNSGAEQWAAWSSALVLGVFWLCYLWGGRRDPASWPRMLCFHATTGLAVLALLGPLDHWAETSTAAHMVQHMLLMVVIAPLWVLCRPLPQLAAASGRIAARSGYSLLRLSAHPVICAYLHGLVIWFWHLPYFYMLAVEDPWWHIIEHAGFLLTAGLFWWSVLNASLRRAPWALFALLFTLMHTGFLGALLTFARDPLYGEARDLVDQQLAGLIMWVLGAIPYITASAWLGHRWYRQMMRRA